MLHTPLPCIVGAIGLDLKPCVGFVYTTLYVSNIIHLKILAPTIQGWGVCNMVYLCISHHYLPWPHSPAWYSGCSRLYQNTISLLASCHTPILWSVSMHVPARWSLCSYSTWGIHILPYSSYAGSGLASTFVWPACHRARVVLSIEEDSSWSCSKLQEVSVVRCRSDMVSHMKCRNDHQDPGAVWIAA